MSDYTDTPLTRMAERFRKAEERKEYERNLPPVNSGWDLLIVGLVLPAIACLFSEISLYSYGMWCSLASIIFGLAIPAFFISEHEARWFMVLTVILEQIAYRTLT